MRHGEWNAVSPSSDASRYPRYNRPGMGSEITDILGDGGRIAAKLAGYELRPEQLEMAEAVHAAFEACEDLVVEAGTGVGKSFAYLVPAILRAIQHGSRVVISTHTIALQEQLIHKDIPFLQQVLPDFSAGICAVILTASVKIYI